jgi:hypothetical protein
VHAWGGYYDRVEELACRKGELFSFFLFQVFLYPFFFDSF